MELNDENTVPNPEGDSPVMSEITPEKEPSTDVPVAPKKRYISDIPVIPQLSVALGLLVVVFGVTYIGVASSITGTSTINDNVRVEKIIDTNQQDERSYKNIFDNISLEAQSAFVWDIKNQKVLFNKNADVQLPLASVTKLMTALVASELLNSDDTVAVSMKALLTEGDSGLLDGEEFTAQNITDLTLISSSNDGAAVLSSAAGSIVNNDSDPEQIFVRAMNIKAQELGMTRTTFSNSTGLDLSETEAGAYGTARDVALLMAYIITNTYDTVALTSSDVAKVLNTDGAYHIAQNTNSAVNDIQGLLASKTGYTVLAGGNLVIAFNAGLNRPIVVAVLGSSYEGRFNDTNLLVDRAREYITNE